MKRILLVVVLLILQLSVCGLYGQSEREKERTLFKKKLGGASGKERIEILSQLSRLYYDDYKLRIQYCEEALKLMETLGEENPELKVELVTRLSEAYGTIGRQTDGFKYMWEAIALYRQLDNKAGLSSAYTSLSYLYRSIDRLDESLKWILKASKLDDETGGYSRFTISLGMGYLYNSLGQYEDSLESLQTALDIAEASKEKMSYIRGKAHVLIAIGLSYRGQGKNLKALDTFFRALEIYLQLENSSGIITASINIANTYNAVGEYKKALANLEKALELAQQKNDKNKICYCYLYLGDVYSNMKKYTESETYYKQAGELAAELKRPNRTQLVYVGLSELEAGRGNYQKALDYYKKYVVIKDSLEVQKNSEQAAELQVRYDFENQTIKISALQKQTDLQGIIRNGLLVVLALILIILGLMFKKYLYLFAFWKKQKYIGQYRLLESIGVGGMGNVFKAHNVRDKEKISAIKVLKDELFKKENNRKRFRQEGTIIDKLVHPHIIRIFERGEYEDKLYIVMEYLEGRTLADAIEEIGEKLPIDRCLHIMVQIADAMNYIHSKHIIHRDMKPANIMLINKGGNPDYVKLLDFGLSRMKYQSQLTHTGVLVGTANYMAPEQITDLNYSTAGDIYSLGIIFYEMLSGKTAFQGDSFTQVEMQILKSELEEPISSRPEIPPDLNQLVMRMINKEPGFRPFADEIKYQLEDIILISLQES